MTSLHFAAAFGHTSVVDVLLNKDAELKERAEPSREAYIECRRTGRTALHFAALHGRMEVVELLLKWGANVDSIDSQGNTVLDRVELYRDERLIQILLDSGAIRGTRTVPIIQ
jgi:ankyrin repeat protein